MEHEKVSIEEAERLWDRYEDEYLEIDGWDGDDVVADGVLIDGALSSDRYIPVRFGMQ